MSAVLPHLEVQNDPSETEAEREWFRYAVDSALEGLQFDPENVPEKRRLKIIGVGVVPREVAVREHNALVKSHAELIRTAFTRRTIRQALEGRTLTVTSKRRKTGVGEVTLQLDEPIGRKPAYNPPGKGDIKKSALLTWTSKMGCPSFSIPAGPGMFGGACPGALAGQSITPVDKAQKQTEHIERVLGVPVVIANCVCQWCYAEGGNYAYGSVQLQQVMRFLWVKSALADGSFHEVMDWAIKNADYKLEGGLLKSKVVNEDGSVKTEEIHYPAEQSGKRFFRIHDSGDFFSKPYLEAWKRLAVSNPDITFWAPTRIWAAPMDIGPCPANLIIRPSAYMVNWPAPGNDMPAIPHASGWSIVFSEDLKAQMPEGVWDCPAYREENAAATCRHAFSGKGCRTCWTKPEKTVNYTKH